MYREITHTSLFLLIHCLVSSRPKISDHDFFLIVWGEKNICIRVVWPLVSVRLYLEFHHVGSIYFFFIFPNSKLSKTSKKVPGSEIPGSHQISLSPTPWMMELQTPWNSRNSELTSHLSHLPKFLNISPTHPSSNTPTPSSRARTLEKIEAEPGAGKNPRVSIIHHRVEGSWWQKLTTNY